jgi:hypothetical protein
MTGSRSRTMFWEWEVPEAICRIPRLGLSCFGCCGYDWAPIDRLRREVEQNTWRFKTLYTSKEVFAETTEGVRSSGICKGVMFLDDGTIGCPLHPARNDGKDLRKGDCLTMYECDTLKGYRTWKEDTKKAFLCFVAEKGYDPFEYSMANAKGSLLSSFKKRMGMSQFSLMDILR